MKIFILTLAFSLMISVGYSQTAKVPVHKQMEAKVQIYPNPTTTFFNIEGDNNQVAAIYLYNLIGKRMKTFDPRKDSDFQVSDLSNGLYLVQMVDANGRIVATSRLTKR